MRQSGKALKEILSDPSRSYNFGDIDILEAERRFSRDDTVTDIAGYASKNIKLHIPFLTSPMPDVTDKHIAILAARMGALGVIPATHDPEEQAEIIQQVKSNEGGFIENPFTLSPRASLHDALTAPYSNIPIVDGGRLIGIFIRQPYEEYYSKQNRAEPLSHFIETDIKKISAAVELVEKNSELDFHRAQEIMMERKIPALAIVSKNGILRYLITMKDVQQETLYPYATRDKKNRLCVGAAIFEYRTKDNMKRIKLLAEQAEVDLFVFDQAHGWNYDVGQMTQYLKEEYPHINVIAGNDSVFGAASFHKKNGADGMRVGQGPGSICTTGAENNVGIWRPQFSAVYDCAREIKFFPCIADGGIRYAYDAFKAYAGGASATMGGKIVAQTVDSPAKEISPGVKQYRGMASPDIAIENEAAFMRYSRKTFVAEGEALPLKVTTTFEKFLKDFSETIRKEFERVGAKNIHELHQKLRSGELRAQFAHNRESR
ncbi:MAG: IMP dehydrogenase [Candidatus Niyogibacteria bacterium]|nr:IMP dehydrogenase [Candidatus Niyogibacteria bacterium]